MQRAIYFHFIGLFCCLALCVAILPSRADWPKPITTPKTDKAPERVISPNRGGVPTPITAPGANTLPGTIKTPDVGGLPSTIGGPNSKPALPVNTTHSHIPLLIKQMRDGKATPQGVWENNLLNVDDLLWILNNSIDSWGGFYWEKDPELRRGVVRLLVQFGGEKLQLKNTLSPVVRLWLADYYQSIGDARCVEICEQIIRETRTPVNSNDATGDNPLIFQTIERLGWYYRDKGQNEKESQTWQRIDQLFAEVGWWTLHAGWHCKSAGDIDAAQRMFERLAQSADPLNRASGHQQQLRMLVESGQIEKARDLINKVKWGDVPDQAQIIRDSFLAHTYLHEKNKTRGIELLKRALAAYDLLKHPWLGMVGYDAAQDRRTLRWLTAQ